MGRKTMLTPNPHKPGSIARVVVINTDTALPLVVNVDPLYQEPRLLGALNPGYTVAVRFWNFVAIIAFVGGLVLAFIWHWWAAPTGITLGYIVQRYNRRSIADFVVQSVIEQKDGTLAHFKAHNLMWVAAPDKLTRDRT